MAINYSHVSEKVFNLIKGYGYDLQSFDKAGDLVIDPQEATRFVVENPNILVRLDIPEETLSLQTSDTELDENLRNLLKEIAQDNLLNFDFRIFNKQLKPKGEQVNVAKQAEKNMADITEASLGKMTGTRKSSYQPLADSVQIIVRHKKEVNEEVRGSRSRNIHSILIQRGEEKFKMAENNLSAARAMARHLYNGGETFDNIGSAITEMSIESRKLREFVRYVKSAKLINETNQEYVELAIENINSIKNTFKKLTGVKTYANAIESIEKMSQVEMLQDDLDLEAKFTETHFDNKVADVMDNLKTIVSRQRSFESKIMSAIESEAFAGIKGLLQEEDVVDFASPEAKLSHQVSLLGNTAKDPMLSNYLHGISSKINTGGQLNQFEYGAVKSCLLSANQKVPQGTPTSVEESYEAFLDRFTE